MSDSKRHRELASKWLRGTINPAEKAEFAAWYNANRKEELHIPDSFAEDEQALRNRILDSVKKHISEKNDPNLLPIRRWWLVGVAASLVLGVVGYLLFFTWGVVGHPVRYATVEEVRPGGNKAKLTLADGRVIDLSEQQSELIIGEQLRYSDGSEVATDRELDVAFAVIEIPKGGQYQLVLSDGTRVWLNSETTLRYPMKFNPDRREVELVGGEAFFKVISQYNDDGKVPFFVKTRNQTVEVLGTAFGIHAYGDEPGVKTTLVEGSVAVRSEVEGDTESRTVLSAPGQQAHVTAAGVTVSTVDIDEYTAWTAGYFYFNDADINTVARQFERWYGITVTHDQGKSDDLFNGKIPREASLGTALAVLKTAGADFEWKDNCCLIIRSKR